MYKMKVKQRVILVTFTGVLLLLLYHFNLQSKKVKLNFFVVETNSVAIDQVIAEQKRAVQKISHEIPNAALIGQSVASAGSSEVLKEIDLHAWDIWENMVTSRSVTSDNEKDVKKILRFMKYSKIMSAEVGFQGTQLKALLHLDGPTPHAVVYKPARYSRDHIIDGNPYDGYDRHNGEIAAFHLDRVFGFFRAPPVVGRFVNLEKEVMSVAKPNLLETFFKDERGNACFYGVCHYCRKEEPACAQGSILEGSLTLWLPSKWPVAKLNHPWQRTYREGKKAKWEVDPSYCKGVIAKRPYDEGPRLLDIMDTSFFDFIIGNADRHHYEYLATQGSAGMIIHMDNAKSFGNPHKDEMSILAPIYQCCRFRNSTYTRLKNLQARSTPLSLLLSTAMRGDPLSPILTDAHLQAVDRRFAKALQMVDACIKMHGAGDVLVHDGL